MITELSENQIFVFGSNLAGIHAGGAAKQAHEQFGAIWGQGEGIQGQSYAFPTLTKSFKKVTPVTLVCNATRLFKCCEDNPDKEFLLTRVGCGIAGFQDEDIRPLFENHPNNLILPEEWRSVEQKEGK